MDYCPDVRNCTVISLSVYLLFIWKAVLPRQSEEQKDRCLSCATSLPNGQSGWGLAKPKPRTRSGFGSPVCMERPKHLKYFVLLLQVHYQETGCQVKHPGLELVPKWECETYWHLQFFFLCVFVFTSFICYKYLFFLNDVCTVDWGGKGREAGESSWDHYFHTFLAFFL